MNQLRIALLGQGRSGRDIHGACLKLLQDKYEIVAIVDPLEDRRRRAETEFGCVTFDSHQALLKRDDIDLVVNATPSHLQGGLKRLTGCWKLHKNQENFLQFSNNLVLPPIFSR